MDLQKAAGLAQVLSLVPGGYCAYAAWVSLHPQRSATGAVPAGWFGLGVPLPTSTSVVLALGAFLGLAVFGLIFGAQSWRRSRASTKAAESVSPIPDLVVEGRHRAVRAQLGGFLRSLYHQTACHAIGGAFNRTGAVVRLLRAQPEPNSVHVLLSDLLVDLWRRTEETLQPMLSAQSCNTDDELTSYVRAWGDVFAAYQGLVAATFRANEAINVPRWPDTCTENGVSRTSGFLP